MAFLDQWFWFVLLLPLAALSGWVIGRRGGERHSDSQVSKLSTTYFRGLNYLLNEQQDKAIEILADSIRLCSVAKPAAPVTAG